MYKLGIVGFGIVGKSVLVFLNRHKMDVSSCTVSTADHTEDPEWFRVSVWDARTLEDNERDIVNVYRAESFDASKLSLDDFIRDNDYVVVSPGIDVGLFKEYSDKFLCELDFFSVFFNKPVIAITGSLGKTTIAKLIGKFINVVPCSSGTFFLEKTDDTWGPPRQLHTALGGNIGIGMLDLCQRQDMYDLAVLELSSFQLEMSKKFSPSIAILTNVYENHLDRHKTLEAYFEAKFNVFRFQREGQVALLDAALLQGDLAHLVRQYVAGLKSDVYFLSASAFNPATYSGVERDKYGGFFLDEQWICKAWMINGVVVSIEKIFDVSCMPDITFMQNWVAIVATLYVLGIDLKRFKDFLLTTQDQLLTDHCHRLEHCAGSGGVDFYNDSKATVMQSTLAAVEKLAQQGRPIILILGGLSKGVDRAPFFKSLKTVSAIKQIYYFGAPTNDFNGCMRFDTLEQAMRAVSNTMQQGDIVLFSPGGASFDFFKNYADRGDAFKALVQKIAR